MSAKLTHCLSCKLISEWQCPRGAILLICRQPVRFKRCSFEHFLSIDNVGILQHPIRHSQSSEVRPDNAPASLKFLHPPRLSFVKAAHSSKPSRLCKLWQPRRSSVQRAAQLPRPSKLAMLSQRLRFSSCRDGICTIVDMLIFVAPLQLHDVRLSCVSVLHCVRS